MPRSEASKAQRREYSRRLYYEHPERVLASGARWRMRNSEKCKAKNAEWQRKNRDRCREKARKWRKDHPDDERRRRLAALGWTISAYDAQVRKQKNLCAICHKPETFVDHRTGSIRRLAADHCHRTGKPRALLCLECNVGIGKFHDEPGRLRAAAEYVEMYASR